MPCSFPGGWLARSRSHCSAPPICPLQGPIKRLAATVDQAVAETQMYLQAVSDSERGGVWNEQVSGAGEQGRVDGQRLVVVHVVHSSLIVRPSACCQAARKGPVS